MKGNLVTLLRKENRNWNSSSTLDNAGISRYNSNHHEHTIYCTYQIPKTWQPKTSLSQNQKASPCVGGIVAHCPVYS